jgi:hypothetical protein
LYPFSIIEGVTPKIRKAIQELQEIQYTRRKARMAAVEWLGPGRARFLDATENIVEEKTSG